MRRHTFTFGEFTSTVEARARSEVCDDAGDRHFFVADTNTHRFVPAGGTACVIPAGEESKSWEQLDRILGAMVQAGLNRDSTVIGIGGGVICDIASLAASIYMRGCHLVLIPTTLLAMVDAALGGKTAVNFGGYKNLAGTFYPASEIRICAEFLHTLPQREYLGGLAEVLKSGMIGDADLFELLHEKSDAVSGRDDTLLTEIVWRCVLVKGNIVEGDLRERGLRAHLNLGHTFAHALESSAGLGSWSHGEAVAWGIRRAMETGAATGMTNREYATRVARMLDRYGFRTEPIPEAAQTFLDAMSMDKKRSSGTGKLILQEDLCVTRVVDLDPDLVLRVLRGEVPLADA